MVGGMDTTLHLVMSKDLNSYGTLFGGKLMGWMDELAVILAIRMTKKECVTFKFNNIEFKKNVKLNDVLKMKAEIIDVKSCRLKIVIKVFKENYINSEEYVAGGIAEFIALDKNKKPVNINSRKGEVC